MTMLLKTTLWLLIPIPIAISMAHWFALHDCWSRAYLVRCDRMDAYNWMNRLVQIAEMTVLLQELPCYSTRFWPCALFLCTVVVLVFSTLSGCVVLTSGCANRPVQCKCVYACMLLRGCMQVHACMLGC